MGDLLPLRPETPEPVYWLTIAYQDRPCTSCGAPIWRHNEFVYAHEPEPTSFCFACAARDRLTFTPSRRWREIHGRQAEVHRGSQLHLEGRTG